MILYTVYYVGEKKGCIVRSIDLVLVLYYSTAPKAAKTKAVCVLETTVNFSTGSDYILYILITTALYYITYTNLRKINSFNRNLTHTYTYDI